MKKYTKLTLFMVACATIVSCNKNELVETTDQTPYTTQELTATDEMLSFNSQEEMYERAALLSEMSQEELKAWYNSTNSDFTSIEQIHQEAISEFEEFGARANGDFKTAEQIKDKYKKILLFNDNPQDEELYAPLIPVSKTFYSYVCNKDGNVKINGNVENFKDVKSFEETNYYKTSKLIDTKSIEERENYIWILDGKRKMWVDVIAVDPHGAYYYPYLALKLEARKKNWLGWMSYATQYSFEFIKGFEGVKIDTYFPEYKDLQYTNPTKEMGAGTKFRIACFVDSYTKMTAEIRMSSRGTGGQSAVLRVNRSYR